MFCPKCGTEVSDDKAFCPECGNPLKSQAQQASGARQTAGAQQASGGQQTAGAQQSWQATGSQNGARPHPQVQFQSDTVVLPDEYKPISMWGYFGYEILFSIPIVGFIVLIVLSINGKNQNVKNFARSYFCFTIIVLILLVILLVTVAGAGASAAFGGYY
ncbi:MAG: zinc-ribbon domain-containing protein [Firmicutes bacterium]|nr:zinc-ribbon domain-containing protein [Bacillota bacterium]